DESALKSVDLPTLGSPTMPIPSATTPQLLPPPLDLRLRTGGTVGGARDLREVLAGELLLLGRIQSLVEELLRDLDRPVGRGVLHLVPGLGLLVLALAERVGLLRLRLGPGLGDEVVAQLLHVLGVAAHHLRSLRASLLDGLLLLGEKTLGLGSLALRRLDRRGNALLPLVHDLQDGSPRHTPEQHGHQDEGDQSPEDEAGTDGDEVGGGENYGHGVSSGRVSGPERRVRELRAPNGGIRPWSREECSTPGRRGPRLR